MTYEVSLDSAAMFLLLVYFHIVPFLSSLVLSVGGNTFSPPCQRIDAAVKWSSNQKLHFFSADEYIVHNDYYNAEENVFRVSELAETFPSNIDAAVSWFGQSRSLYFKGCFYYQYHEVRKRLRRGRLSRLNLPCDVDAAVDTDGAVLVFKGCQYWKITRTNRRRAILGGATADLGLPCGLDAAFTRPNTTSYVIKGDVTWALSSSDHTAAYRSGFDDFTVCSWRICRDDVADTGRSGAQVLPDRFPCNGDPRFCALKFDQVTLAGSHNAGSGFDGGFGFVNCWVRNQYMTILEQLRFGMRFLDVDTSWNQCGLLGTFHSVFCGGPVCRILKQIKRFLRENRHEVVAINFNHEMQDVEAVLPALIRQITSQLGDDINTFKRDVGRWPSLRYAITSDKRLFVIMDARVRTLMYRSYAHHRWIHSEEYLHSTWRGGVMSQDHCDEVVESSRNWCQRKQTAPLLELSVFGYSTGCVTSIADYCLPLVHNISRGCQGYRYSREKAPNVLLVDFPDLVAHPALSVVSAAFLQNTRNVASLARGTCRLIVDAAVTWREEAGGEEKVLFFLGSRRVLFNWRLQTQEQVGAGSWNTSHDFPTAVDAAFRRAQRPSEVCFVSGCTVACRHGLTSDPRHLVDDDSLVSLGLPCDIDAAFTRGNTTYFLKGCHFWQMSVLNHVTGPQPNTALGLPCDVSAALQTPAGDTYFFMGGLYGRPEQTISELGSLLDWSADFLQC